MKKKNYEKKNLKKKKVKKFSKVKIFSEVEIRYIKEPICSYKKSIFWGGTFLRNRHTHRLTDRKVGLHSCLVAAKKQDFFLPPRYSIFSGDHDLLGVFSFQIFFFSNVPNEHVAAF